MAADPNQFERLVQELADLAPEERARLIAAAVRRAKSMQLRPRFRAPTLTGGTAWIGGDVRREEIYDEDGR